MRHLFLRFKPQELKTVISIMEGFTPFRVQDKTYRVFTGSLPKSYSIPTVEETSFESTSTDDFSVQETADIITTTMPCSPSVFPSIIGKRGAVIKSLQYETKCDIIIPKQSEKTSEITLRGTERQVKSAKSRIQKIIDKFQTRKDYTHFLSLPINHPDIGTSVNSFHENLIKMSIPNFDPSIIVPPTASHLTIAVLKLYTQEDIQRAIECLKESSSEIYDLVGTTSVLIKVKGVDIMVGTAERAHVIYGKIDRDEGQQRIMKVCERIITNFIAAGLLPPDTPPPKLHLTLLNTRYRSRQSIQQSTDESSPKSKNRYGGTQIPISATSILSSYGDHMFGTVRIEEIQICKMGARDFDGQGKKYQSVGTIRLP
ncbi:AKAP7 2'5' RNA ligase-like domain-containing protein [Paraphysoderma sedebokerense]|nr:AKAP7 2'5' RNA ligase-like domain-containing protein [Paraphysoderma sedebokerense]